MMTWSEVDGDLIHVESGHVFERGDHSRAAYKHMCIWLKDNFEPELGVDENWARAEEVWNHLSPEHQMYVWSIYTRDQQQAEDTCTLLLSALSKSRATDHIKQKFEEAIRRVASATA
jgi:phage gp36-like protein